METRLTEIKNVVMLKSFKDRRDNNFYKDLDIVCVYCFPPIPRTPEFFPCLSRTHDGCYRIHDETGEWVCIDDKFVDVLIKDKIKVF